MNQKKLWRFLALALVSAVFLTACAETPTEEKGESDTKGEISQGQTEGGLEEDLTLDPGQTTPDIQSSDPNQSVSNNGGGDAPVSSAPTKPGATIGGEQKPNSGSGSSGATEPGSAGNEAGGSSSNSSSSNGNSSNTGSNEGNKPEQSTPSAKPENPSQGGSTPPAEPKPNTDLTYAEYLKMTPVEQQAYYESYENVMDFIAWHNAAKAKYDAEKDSIQIEGGNIDIGEIMGKN